MEPLMAAQNASAHLRIGILPLVLATVFGLSGRSVWAETPQVKDILIDGIHANDLSTVGLGPEVYEYHQSTGCRRSFEYLRAQGLQCDRVAEGQLDDKLLAQYRMVYLNLPSAERPPFLVSEIAAIRKFIAEGGSLLAVMDHSNVYFHAHRLRPLLAELGIESPTDTACDLPPHTLGTGYGWIAIRDFRPHPVTRDLAWIAFQTGGRVDPRYAVAWTSEQSWADPWRTGIYGKENAPGFYGNMERDPGESPGPLGVVLARQLGRGRIAIVADQNMLGESFLNYADNYRLWLNALGWLLQNDRLRDPKPYEQWRSPRILCYERPGATAFGIEVIQGSYHAFVLLSRHWWTFAGHRLDTPSDLIVFAHNDTELPDDAASAVAAHLRRGKNVLVLNAESHTLWDRPGVIGQTLHALSIAQPEAKKSPGRLRFEIPQGGTIHVFGPDGVLDNGVLPSPIEEPTDAQQEQVQRFLKTVRDALGR